MLVPQAVLRGMLRTAQLGFVMFSHGVTEDRPDRFVSNVHLPFDQFQKTIEFYENLGFEFVSMERLIEMSQTGFRRQRPWIHLTFDDGYENNLTLLQPYLQGKKIPWTIFVSTNHVQQQRRFGTYLIRCALVHATRDVALPGMQSNLPVGASRQERISAYSQLKFKTLDKTSQLELVQRAQSALDGKQWRRLDSVYAAEKVLTAEQLNRLVADPLVHIGSHNHNHIVLNHHVSPEDVAYEMRTSKEWLKRTIGVDAVSYCYPNGQSSDFSAMTKRMCEDAGYKIAFTTISRAVPKDVDPYKIPRKAIAESLARSRGSMARAICKEFLKHVCHGLGGLLSKMSPSVKKSRRRSPARTSPDDNR